MNKDFIWIDESYDHSCMEGNKFYLLCAIKLFATPQQITRHYNKKGESKGEIHKHILDSYKITKAAIKKMNKNKKKKKDKLRVNELHENELVSNRKTKRIKTIFLKNLFPDDSDVNIEIYYVYYNFRDDIIKNDKELYRHMAKELLNVCYTSNQSTITLDVCFDNFSKSEQHEDVISFLRKECNIKPEDYLRFDDSQSNYGLQAVDNIIGTIRRYLHQQKDNKENYEIIKNNIIEYREISIENKKVVNI